MATASSCNKRSGAMSRRLEFVATQLVACFRHRFSRLTRLWLCLRSTQNDYVIAALGVFTIPGSRLTDLQVTSTVESGTNQSI